MSALMSVGVESGAVLPRTDALWVRWIPPALSQRPLFDILDAAMSDRYGRKAVVSAGASAGRAGEETAGVLLIHEIGSLIIHKLRLTRLRR